MEKEDCCCECLAVLVDALKTLHHHKCECKTDAEQKCCGGAIELVIGAIRLELDCLSSCCK